MPISVPANASPPAGPSARAPAHHVVAHDATNSPIWIVASRADRGTARKLTPRRPPLPTAARRPVARSRGRAGAEREDPVEQDVGAALHDGRPGPEGALVERELPDPGGL